MRTSFKFEGFVIGQKELGERDKKITLLTKKRGKLVALAKGVRRIDSKRSGILETGNQIRGIISPARDYLIFQEADLVSQPFKLRANLVLNASLLFVCELIDRLLPENEENKEVWRLFGQTIRHLEKERRVEILIIFEVELLKALGFGLDDEVESLIVKRKWRLAQKKLDLLISSILEKKISGLKIFLN